jgi:hypothetical protein
MPRSEVHDKYDALRAALDAALSAAREFAKDPDAQQFKWEYGEIEGLVRQARRYAGKPGEVLYCNWRWCVHAAEFEDQERGASEEPKKADEARALLPGEGEQWFKGRVHPECWEAIQNRRGG